MTDKTLSQVIAELKKFGCGTGYPGYEMALQIIRTLVKREELLREALEFYSSPSDYIAPYAGGIGKLYFDCGDKANTHNVVDVDKERKAFERITETLYEGDFSKYDNGAYTNEIQQYQWEGFHDGWKAAKAESSSMLTEKELLREALDLILPMAKGYAHQHRVGSNSKYILCAEQALSLTDPNQPWKG